MAVDVVPPRFSPGNQPIYSLERFVRRWSIIAPSRSSPSFVFLWLTNMVFLCKSLGAQDLAPQKSLELHLIISGECEWPWESKEDSWYHTKLPQVWGNILNVGDTTHIDPFLHIFCSACCWLWLWYVMMVICDVYQEMDRGKLPFHSPSVFTARSSESKRDLRRIEGMYRKVIMCCWCCWWWWWWRRWWRWWCWAELEGGVRFWPWHITGGSTVS